MTLKFKQILKKCVVKYLFFFARIKLKRVNPYIIGITGSSGKTSVKDCLYEILKTDFEVKATKKSSNSELGIPLDILDLESPYNNPKLWTVVFIKAFLSIFKKAESYKYYVVEMGVDKPNDINLLFDLLQPNLVVILDIREAHLANFIGGYTQYFNEKLKILKSKNLAKAFVFNDVIKNKLFDSFKESIDDQSVFNKIQTFGWNSDSDAYVSGVSVTSAGITALVTLPNLKELEFVNNRIVGKDYAINFLVSYLVSDFLGISSNKIVESISRYELPPGRLNLLKGINNSLIIDSTYNASPAPMKMAIESLSYFRNMRRIACLGDMRELGSASELAHIELAKQCLRVCDFIVTVGPLMSKYMVPELIHLGYDSNCIKSFSSSKEASEFVFSIVKPNDIFLVKGSQNTIFMERIVYKLMLEKENARKLLCRQEPYWDTMRGNKR